MLDHSIDESFACHFRDGAFAFEHVHFEAKLIAGDHRFAESRAIDGDEQHQFAVAVRDAPQDKDSGCLRHCFDNQHAWHHGKVGKMAVEKWFIRGDVFDADNAFGFEFDDLVHQQKRVSVWQNLPDLVHVHQRTSRAGHGNCQYT
jgi:hypothetical protein